MSCDICGAPNLKKIELTKMSYFDMTLINFNRISQKAVKYIKKGKKFQHNTLSKNKVIKEKLRGG